MKAHIAALYTHDERGRMLLVNEPSGSGGPAPRAFLGRTAGGNLWKFRAGIPEALEEELEAIFVREPVGFEWASTPVSADTVSRLLETYSHVVRVDAGPAYCFDTVPAAHEKATAISKDNCGLLESGFEDLVEEVPDGQPFFAIVRDGRAVSVCRSVRITPYAHEAGVETLPEFRGVGYAGEAAKNWAAAVAAIGALPLYSTSWENTASQAVARKLGLIAFGADFHVT